MASDKIYYRQGLPNLTTFRRISSRRIVRRACLNRIHVELQSYIRGSVANDDYVLFVPSGFSLSAYYVQLA
jgi:hypothetical protein